MNPNIVRLSNGLTIVTEAVLHVETISMGVWVNVGSRHETPEINGISHLLEHMAFKGTRTRTARDIAETIENVGGYLNAHTSREHTAFTARVLKEDLELSIDIISDILQNPIFDEEELKREKGVVIQEIYQSYDTPDDIIFDYYKETAFPNQPIGRSILGSVETVQSITSENLFKYMKDYYHPSQMILSIVGNLEHAEVARLAEKYFIFPQSLPAKTEPLIPLAYVGGERLIQRDLEQIHMVLGYEGASYGSDDFYASSILSVILSGGMSSRLFQEIREKRGLVYSISTFNTPYHDGGLFNLYAGTSPEHIEELIPATINEFKKAIKSIESAELRRARSQFKAALLMGMESLNARCEKLANHLLHYGRVIPKEEIIDKIASVTSEDIQNIAAKIFNSPPTFTAIGKIENLPSINN